MPSPCCGAPTYLVFWPSGWHVYCSYCGATLGSVADEKPKRDLIAWLFPPEKGPRPSGERVFYRHGKRLTTADRTRGKPDAWFWIDA